MPWIHPSYLDCVVYLYPSEAEAQDGEKIGGSGFAVGIPIEGAPGYVLACIVTNKHVIDSGNMTVRVNTHTGATDVIPLDGAKWYLHPSGDDLAVCPISLSANHKIITLDIHSFVRKDFVDGFGIGPGDDVFVVGRFINHEGKQRNLPSVRFGNIAQMPWEPIMGPTGFAQEAYLIEGRSISGYSGAPVFVIVPPAMQKIGYMKDGGWVEIDPPFSNPKRKNNVTQLIWFLGVDYCHIRWDEPVWNRQTGKPQSPDWYVKTNTGMMGVIPAWRLLDILDGDEMKPLVKDMTQVAKKAIETNASAIELDVAHRPAATQAEPGAPIRITKRTS